MWCGQIFLFTMVNFSFSGYLLDSIQDSKFEGCNLDKINSVMYPYLWGQLNFDCYQYKGQKITKETYLVLSSRK